MVLAYQDCAATCFFLALSDAVRRRENPQRCSCFRRRRSNANFFIQTLKVSVFSNFSRAAATRRAAAPAFFKRRAASRQCRMMRFLRDATSFCTAFWRAAKVADTHLSQLDTVCRSRRVRAAAHPRRRSSLRSSLPVSQTAAQWSKYDRTSLLSRPTQWRQAAR